MKKFMNPELEVNKFDVEDVIATSVVDPSVPPQNPGETEDDEW